MQVVPRSSQMRLFAAIVVVIGGFLFYWFGPWHLFVDRRVDEALPSIAAEQVPQGEPQAVGPSPSGGQPTGQPTITVLAEGSFRSLAHGTAGTAKIVELADGSRFVRFEDLDTDSGPDLRVYLSEAPADADAGRIDDAFVDLGPLKGNQGDQNYAIPGDLDLSEIRSVSVWCRRFSVGFGVAPLEVR